MHSLAKLYNHYPTCLLISSPFPLFLSHSCSLFVSMIYLYICMPLCMLQCIIIIYICQYWNKKKKIYFRKYCQIIQLAQIMYYLHNQFWNTILNFKLFSIVKINTCTCTLLNFPHAKIPIYPVFRRCWRKCINKYMQTM